MLLNWSHNQEKDEYTATTPDHILVAYYEEDCFCWNWVAMLNDGSHEPAGAAYAYTTARAAMDAAAAWSSDS